MPLPSRLDVLAAVLAAATGLAMAKDRGRTEISPSPAVTAEAANPEILVPEILDPDLMTPEICAELAEYRRRALRAAVILAGGLPDAEWPGQPKGPSAECAVPQVPAGGPKPANNEPAGAPRD